eukprot:Gb_30267 [translate_table: standard]
MHLEGVVYAANNLQVNASCWLADPRLSLSRYTPAGLASAQPSPARAAIMSQHGRGCGPCWPVSPSDGTRPPFSFPPNWTENPRIAAETRMQTETDMKTQKQRYSTVQRYVIRSQWSS